MARAIWESPVDGNHASQSDQVLRMIQGILATDPDSGAERVGYDTENMDDPARLICVGDGLHGKRARRDDHVIFAGRDLAGDCVRCGQVVFSIEALNCDVAAVDEAFGCEGVEHTADAVIQNRLRGVLHDRYPADPGSASFTLTPV
jgi:hypothetical protein